jgi:hypothetical protein
MMDEIALAAMMKQQQDENKPGQGGNTGNSSTGVSLPQSSAPPIQLSAPRGVPGGNTGASSITGGGMSPENSTFRSRFASALDDAKNIPPAENVRQGLGQAVGLGATGLLRNYAANRDNQSDANAASGKRNQTPPKDEGT